MQPSSEEIKGCLPAGAVIKRCGGPKIVAEWLGLDRSAVLRWTHERPKGTGGMIPPKYWPALIDNARQAGTEIDATDLLPDSLRCAQ